MKTLTYACVVFFAVVAAAVPSLLPAQTPAPSLAKELAASFQRAATEILDVAEVMPAEKYGFKPTPEISSFGDQLVHVGGITQRFIDTAKGTKTEAAHHGAMAKPEIIDLLKKTFQSAQDVISPLTDAQLLEPVKFPFGDRRRARGGRLRVPDPSETQGGAPETR